MSYNALSEGSSLTGYQVNAPNGSWNVYTAPLGSVTSRARPLGSARLLGAGVGPGYPGTAMDTVWIEFREGSRYMLSVLRQPVSDSADGWSSSLTVYTVGPVRETELRTRRCPARPGLGSSPSRLRSLRAGFQAQVSS